MTDLTDAVDAIVAAADDGVSFDGLSASRDDGGYRFSVPDGEWTGLDEAEFRDCTRQHEEYVTEWYFWNRVAPQVPDRRSFLRWVEGADKSAVLARRRALAGGVSRTWGQLHVTVTADGGGVRSYAVRHEADADEPIDDLSVFDDLHEVRKLARYDDRGGYRPLATAPTLPTGWILADLDASGLVRTVESVYPATIADWYREREGNLDVTHWRETAERQTGIYDVVEDLRGERVEWLAEACCVDSQCLKRREWDETADESLDVPRGEGEFPCREPCSFVIATARECLVAERDGTEREDFSLTEAERHQLERILEAVAEDEIHEIRDGDIGDGANRLRARYLRAKLADRTGLGVGRSAGDDADS